MRLRVSDARETAKDLSFWRAHGAFGNNWRVRLTRTTLSLPLSLSISRSLDLSISPSLGYSLLRSLGPGLDAIGPPSCARRVASRPLSCRNQIGNCPQAEGDLVAHEDAPGELGLSFSSILKKRPFKFRWIFRQSGVETTSRGDPTVGHSRMKRGPLRFQKHYPLSESAPGNGRERS